MISIKLMIILLLGLRPLIIERLLEAFPTIKSVKVHRAALWILGEYASTASDIVSVMNQIKQALGEVLLLMFSIYLYTVVLGLYNFITIFTDL